jgi:hypothetical protein
MKKIYFYSLLAATAMLGACSDDDYNDWASPQQSTEEPQSISFPENAVKVSDTIRIADIEGDSVCIAHFAAPNVTDATAVLTGYKLYLENQTFEFTSDSVCIPKEALSTIVTDKYGKSPEARELEGMLRACYKVNEQDVYANTDSFKIVVVPDAPFISTGYYLTGDFNGWNMEGLYAFAHSGDDVYANPIFTLVFTTTGDNQYWKIIPQSNIDAGNMWIEGETGVVGTLVDGDTSLEGSLTTSGPQAGKIESAGTYLLTIDMMNYTYSIKAIANEYYGVGTIQGWSDSNKACLFYPQSAKVFTYTTKWTGAWDLKIWNGNDFGMWDNAYGCITDGDNSESGTLINSGAQAISAPSADYYTFTADFDNNTYTWTKIDTPAEYSAITLSGDFNGWSDTPLTQVSTAVHNWTGTVTIESDGGIKFKANNSRDVNWGTDVSIDQQYYGKGTQNGSNISIQAGTYNVYFNDITGEFAFVKQ